MKWVWFGVKHKSTEAADNSEILLSLLILPEPNQVKKSPLKS